MWRSTRARQTLPAVYPIPFYVSDRRLVSYGPVILDPILARRGISRSRQQGSTRHQTPGAIVECLKNPVIVAEAKRTFKDEIGGVEYRPLLPSHQKPPIDLNRTTMDKHRPLISIISSRNRCSAKSDARWTHKACENHSNE